MRLILSTLLLCLLSPTLLFAAGPVAESVAEVADAKGLETIDWILIVIYGLGTICLGWYFGRKQKSTTEYFIGSGNMNPFLVGISLFATLLSTISYLSMPGEALGKGPVFLATILALPLVYWFVAYLLLPVYMKQRVTSAYELLEVKLGLSIRLLGATMFVALRLAWMSLLIYLSSKALVEMMGIPVAERTEWIQGVAIVAGLVAIIYTSIGGLRAVVITDFLQTMLLFGGAWLVIAAITWSLGGVGWFPTEWQSHWDTQPLIDFDPRTRVTLFGTVIGFLIWYICTAGGDQTSVQRFMATEDLRASRRALATQLTAAACVAITLGLVGFALMGYFQANPDLIPADTLKSSADQLFPLFIAEFLPAGISGLVVAAMFAAAMSSIDSGVNSITAVVMTDYLDRFGWKPKTERQHVLFARLLAFGIGAIVVFASAYFDRIPGNITAVTQKTSNLLTTPIFALFCFALFVPFATPIGVWAGAICGTFTAVVIAFSGPILVWMNSEFGVDPASFGVEIKQVVDASTGKSSTQAVPEPVTFQWIAPVALAANLGSGIFVSWLTRKKTPSETPTSESET